VILARLVALVVLGWAAAESLGADPLRVVFIGDSITQGGRYRPDDVTFRYPLYRELQQAGWDVDFVGRRHAGFDSAFPWPEDFDPDHEGFYGQTTRDVEQQVEEDLAALEVPDVAVLLLGENDNPDHVGDTLLRPLTDIVANLRVRNPEVQIVLVQIPGFWKNLVIHWRVWLLAQGLGTPESLVTVVPLDEDWNAKADTYDGDHPNPQGQAKIAAKLLPVLEACLSRAASARGRGSAHRATSGRRGWPGSPRSPSSGR
jgi:lysophospholipase L1-like esterase